MLLWLSLIQNITVSITYVQVIVKSTNIIWIDGVKLIFCYLSSGTVVRWKALSTTYDIGILSPDNVKTIVVWGILDCEVTFLRGLLILDCALLVV